MNVTAGLSGSAELVVREEHTAPRIGSGKVRVLATPVMINLMEAAALAAVERLLPPGYQSLGTHLDVHHVAATPVGMRIRASAVVEKVAERKVFFRVEAREVLLEVHAPAPRELDHRGAGVLRHDEDARAHTERAAQFALDFSSSCSRR